MVIVEPKKFTGVVYQNLAQLKFSLLFLGKLVGRCSGWSVRFAVGRSGVHSLSRVITKDFKKCYSQLPCLALSIKKGIVRRTSRQACLLCPWAKHLTGCLGVYVADRWRTRTSPGYNCEAAHPVCKRRLLGTYQWQSALLVVGLPVTHDCFKMGCHLSPSLIQLS